MPEISGQGQKKLLGSSISVFGENVKDLFSLTLYLSAMGIGHINCYFENKEGYDLLFSQATDLNTDVKVQLIKDDFTVSDIRLVIGSIDFIKKTTDFFINENAFIPTILSVINQWKVGINKISDLKELSGFNELLDKSSSTCNVSFVSAVSGTICAIEAVKHILNIGNTLKDMLVFDLYNMGISTYEKNEAKRAIESLNIKEEIDYKNAEEKLSNAKVLIVGAGGLGSPSSLALAMAGVGTIGLVDSDVVEISNLNRQVLHSSSRIGISKADSAKFILMSFNPQIKIDTYIENLTKKNAEELIDKYDLVISAVDNIQTRYLINDACYFMKKPVIEAGVLRFDGTNTTIIPDKGHCYRCLYPNLNTKGMSCAETGVLGAVPGLMGFIQAAEAYKVITGLGTNLRNKILLFDGLDMEFNVINLDKNPDCPLCGNNPTIEKLQDYTFRCNRVD
ncbi:MAG: thiazole biosynthesis adenylyltransferase ThiF [Sedimentibacter sp.]|jgi:molybdopterin/thiamine biosynthesis adenylyltransferase|nr:thiazole biosynthesis adenylyltransferase ThiF [Sedimentibacter sp.]